MNVYTYYEDINFQNQPKILELWRLSWRRNGFNPIVLNEDDARKSPLYESYSNKIKSFPSDNGAGFDYHCFMRYLAVTTQKEIKTILTTEPDVINYSLNVDSIKSMRKYYMCQYSIVPALQLGSKQQFVDFCKKVINHQLNEQDNYKGRPHLSDQDFIARYNAIKRFYPNNYVCEVFEDDYLTKPVVHFCTPYMAEKNCLPKDYYIEKIRPLIN